MSHRIEPDLGPEPADASVVALLTGLYDAIDRRDIEAVAGCFGHDARIPDSLEGEIVVGRDAIRAYYLRQFATIQVNTSLISAHRLPDGAIRAHLLVRLDGAEGGSWGEGQVKVTYRLHAGQITEMVVDETVGI